MPDNSIDESLKRANLRPDEGGPSQGTMQEARKEFQRPDVPRPDAGPSMVSRLLTKFRGNRDDSRSDSRK